jgi:hypothetical protein
MGQSAPALIDWDDLTDFASGALGRIGSSMSLKYPGFSQGAWPARPSDFLIHGTRGGQADRQKEFQSTCNWVMNPANGGLGWHVTIGDDTYEPHLPITEWGYHAREASRLYIGIEFVQPTAADAITEGQIAAFGRWYWSMVVPAYSHLTAQTTTLPMHSETAAGIRDGKSDVFPRGDSRIHALRARLWGVMAGVSPGELEDIALEAAWQRERATLGEKRYKAHIDRPQYTGAVLVCERGIVAPTQAQTTTARGEMVNDWETYLTDNNVLVKL